ncbi:hypothetical protein TRVL_01485 [Trypanosoma vivax]|nr:hypothetical protein TRVL_01485 [Trypanosoma vivax]
MKRLQVCVCGARNLRDTDMLSLPDAYCSVRVGDKTVKTKVVHNNCDPVWNETFRFNLTDETNTQVCIELWDKNVLTEDILGSYCFSLSSLTMGIVEDSWFLLSHSKTDAEIHIRVLACDFGRKPDASLLWMMTSDINACPAADINSQLHAVPDAVVLSAS